MSEKRKFPRAAAIEVARELCEHLKPVTRKLVVAGSLRRRKEQVGDVELLFVPHLIQVAPAQPDLLGGGPPPELHNVTHITLDNLVASGLLEKRKNVNGSEMWGAKNRLAVHVASGIPVDLFTATAANWFNYLVCRTGGAENNVAIASAAQAKGWKWNPYGPGFTDEEGGVVPVQSEVDAFTLVGLPYLEPWERR